MNKTFTVEFVCNYMNVVTSVDVDEEMKDEDIAITAGHYVNGNYGFNPFELCYDYEINEV